MLNFLAPAEHTPDGLPRRSFLQLGMGGLALGQLAQLQAANPQAEKTAVILFWMAGGPSHIDTYDRKPNAPEQVRGPFSSIDTNLPGLDVCELMPRHAAIGKHLSVIRSITHHLSVHDDGSHFLETGYPLFQARQKGQQNPAVGAVVAKCRGANQPDMPPYVCIPEDYRSFLGFFQGASYLGSKYHAVNSGGDPALGHFNPPEFRLAKDVDLGRLGNRRELLRRIDSLRSELDRHVATQPLDTAQSQAFHLMTGQRITEVFDVTRESDAMRDRYGRHAYGQGALLARRLVEAGVTFVTINLYDKDVDWWDDHYTIEKNLRKRLPMYDQAFASLIEDLHERGMSDRVLVAAYGEFGRNPQVDHLAGRGHWPKAMSAVLSGGGIRAGQIIGATTSNGGEPADRAMDPGDLVASVYHALGIDHTQTLPDPVGRPTRLVEGEPIEELFG